MKDLVRLLPGVVLIVVCATVVGLAFNSLREGGLPLVREAVDVSRAFVSSSQLMQSVETKESLRSGNVSFDAPLISLHEAKTMLDDKSALFIDSRSVNAYKCEHIFGAISLDHREIDKLYSSVLGRVPKDLPIVVTSRDLDCGDGLRLADELILRGHTHVAALVAGVQGWKEAGYPTARGKCR